MYSGGGNAVRARVRKRKTLLFDVDVVNCTTSIEQKSEADSKTPTAGTAPRRRAPNSPKARQMADPDRRVLLSHGLVGKSGSPGERSFVPPHR